MASFIAAQRFSTVRQTQWFVFTLCILCGLTACETAGRPTSEVIADRNANPQVRIRALRTSVQEPAVLDDAYWQQLEGILFSNREPASLRVACLNQLYEYQPHRLREALRHRILSISHWDVLDPALAIIAEANWQDCLGAVVRSYARVSNQYEDAQRPEHATIQSLSPNITVEAAIESVLFNEQQIWNSREQTDAWLLLQRLVPQQILRSRLVSGRSPTALVADLQAAALLLDQLPQTRDEILWLFELRQNAHTWQAIEQTIQQLSAEQRQGLAIRHLPVLLARAQRTQANARWTNKQILQQQLQNTLARAQTVQRTESRMRQQPVDERFDTHLLELVWADLIVLDEMRHAMQQHDVVEAWFTQADADFIDRTSEHGGVLMFATDGYEAVAFEPLLRGNDYRYVPPPELLPALFQGLAHYHFHAQSHDNSTFAGPGEGDLDFANRVQCNCLVLTFINQNQLNVDAYFPDERAIDLGTITRPR